jgi:hypothetical protein
LCPAFFFVRHAEQFFTQKSYLTDSFYPKTSCSRPDALPPLANAV